MTLFSIITIKAGWLFDPFAPIGGAALLAGQEWSRLQPGRACQIIRDEPQKCVVEVTFLSSDPDAIAQLAATCSAYGLEVARLS